LISKGQSYRFRKHHKSHSGTIEDETMKKHEWERPKRENGGQDINLIASGPSGVGRNLRQIRFQLCIITLRIQTSESHELAHRQCMREYLPTSWLGSGSLDPLNVTPVGKTSEVEISDVIRLKSGETKVVARS